MPLKYLKGIISRCLAEKIGKELEKLPVAWQRKSAKSLKSDL
jgi:hypothetical protein